MLGLSVDAFWRMPLCTWLAALEGFGELHGGARRTERLNRAELNVLIKQYPDQPMA